MASVAPIRFLGVRLKLLSHASFLKVSNSLPLKFGL
jgi:hypothetical protein